jgi:hypothetical protein
MCANYMYRNGMRDTAKPMMQDEMARTISLRCRLTLEPLQLCRAICSTAMGIVCGAMPPREPTAPTPLYTEEPSEATDSTQQCIDRAVVPHMQLKAIGCAKRSQARARSLAKSVGRRGFWDSGHFPIYSPGSKLAAEVPELITRR